MTKFYKKTDLYTSAYLVVGFNLSFDFEEFGSQPLRVSPDFSLQGPQCGDQFLVVLFQVGNDILVME